MVNMRGEEEVFQQCRQIVMQDDKVRLAVLEGSRTNKNVPPDKYQDYDFSFFVTDMEAYTKADDWLAAFGDRVFMQKPEDMELYEATFEHWYSYIMYFSDGTKIDLTMIPLEDVDEYFAQSDGLVDVFIDKDDLVDKPIVPTDEKYWIQKPNAREFDDCCNEFWSVSTYVVKGLVRGEHLFALDHLNQILRPELLRVMSWDIGIRHGFDRSLGKNAKYIHQYLSKKEYETLLQTFSLGSDQAIWESFELCCQLFRIYSKKVAHTLTYTYPTYDEQITNYIRNVYHT